MDSLVDHHPGVFDTPAREESGATDPSYLVLLPKLLVIVSVLTLVVNGLLPQLEMAVTGGSLLFLPHQLTVLMVGLGSMVLLKGRLQRTPLLPLTLVLGCYFLLEALYLHFAKDLSYPAIRTSLEAFIFIALVGAASAIPLHIKSRHVLASLMSITVACLIISAAQFITNTPVVRTESNDFDFHVQSYHFLDQTRGFSLFTNGLEAGYFYSLMGGIAMSFCLRRGTRALGFLLFPLCAFGCYVTYTRLAMIGFLVTVLSVVVISSKGLIAFRKLLPLFSLVCALLLIFAGLGVSGGAGRTDLANVFPLEARVMAWGVYAGKFLGGSRADIMLGIGQGPYTPYTSPNRLENAAPIPVDNAYLLALLSCGVCGLLVLAASYWYLWSFLMHRVSASGDHLVRGIAGMFATIPFFCCINDLPTQTILLLIFVVALGGHELAAASAPLVLDLEPVAGKGENLSWTYPSPCVPTTEANSWPSN